jgi:predicted enzyme related to lactoylglutathione lyase
MTTGIRKPGEFCWINMLTPQPDEARVFYGKMLGWTYAELPGMGHLVKVAGHDIGGIFDLHGPNTPPGLPPYIGVMVKVESADATAEKVIALGGKARPAFDITDQGRMSVCFDPNGAEFDIWEPKKGTGTDVDSSVHGAPSWFETLTTDVEAATEFYSSLFGWTPEVQKGPTFDYTTFKKDGTPVAGMMKITPAMGAMRAHWGVYFSVRDADLAFRQAGELGAKICVTMKDIPDIGRFFGMTSPQGVVLYVIEYARPGVPG